jgi:hypothetical protein
LPGAEAVARAEMPLLTDSNSMNSIEISGVEQDDLISRFDVVSHDYFKALGIGVHQGRAFTAANVASSEKVALVNRKFVADYLPAGEALGRTIQFGHDQKVTIVGVVDDISPPTCARSSRASSTCRSAQAHDGSADLLPRTEARRSRHCQFARRRRADPQLPLAIFSMAAR